MRMQWNCVMNDLKMFWIWKCAWNNKKLISQFVCVIASFQLVKNGDGHFFSCPVCYGACCLQRQIRTHIVNTKNLVCSAQESFFLLDRMYVLYGYESDVIEFSVDFGWTSFECAGNSNVELEWCNQMSNGPKFIVMLKWNEIVMKMVL